MCGIWGVIKQGQHMGLGKADIAFLKSAAVAGQLRGMDGSGFIAGRKDGGVVGYKSMNHPNDMFYDKALEHVFGDQSHHNYRFLFGHNRAATKGVINTKNAHPFKRGDITMIHNGTLRSALPEGFDVDSDWLCHELSTKDNLKVLEDINGAYVLVWYNKKTKKLSIARNHERPLHFMEDGDSLYYTSEKLMLQWLWDRHVRWGQYSKMPEIYSVAPHKLCIFDMETQTWENLDVKKPQPLGAAKPAKVLSLTHSTKTTSGPALSHRLLDGCNKKPEIVFMHIATDIVEVGNQYVHRYVGICEDTGKDVVVQSPVPLDLEEGGTYRGDYFGKCHIMSNELYLPHMNVVADTVKVVSLPDDMDDSDLDDATAMVELYDGMQMSEEDFLKQAKQRCVSCRSQIDLQDASHSILAKDGGLHCPDCVDTMVTNSHFNIRSRNVHSIQ